jgi:hypothetical protein
LTGARASAIELVAAHLADPASGWSIGASGVLAEFMRDAAEPCRRDRFQVATARGAIRVDPSADLTALAYEVLSAQPGLWHHGILFSLSAAAAALPVRAVVTELGPDRDAIRDVDNAAVLFDLGLGSSAFAFCVRTADVTLLRMLRRAAGGGFLAAGRDFAATLVTASPHRVAISRVARIEVYQPIAAEGGATPSGPHTHLMPRLLRPARAASANIPLMPGRIPAFTLYPPHPAKDAAGVKKPFSRAEHDAFQRLLAMFGDPVSVAAKTELAAAIERGDSPAAWRAPGARNARQACRIALRQLRLLGKPAAALAGWEQALEGRRAA